MVEHVSVFASGCPASRARGGSRPLDGQSFSAPRQLLPEPVLALLGNPAGVTAPHANVYAVASQAAPIGFSLNVGSEITTTLTLPLKFHMVNSLLGSHCYIGTDADPIVLTLTTGTSGTLTGTLGSLNVFDNGKVLQTVGTEVVDGQFSVPAATAVATVACGTTPSTPPTHFHHRRGPTRPCSSGPSIWPQPGGSNTSSASNRAPARKR